MPETNSELDKTWGNVTATKPPFRRSPRIFSYETQEISLLGDEFDWIMLTDLNAPRLVVRVLEQGRTLPLGARQYRTRVDGRLLPQAACRQ